MLLQRLDFLLPYTVKRLTSADVGEILALQAKHLEYHQHYQTRSTSTTNSSLT